MAIDIGQTTDGIIASLSPKYDSTIISDIFTALKKIKGIDPKVIYKLGSNLDKKVMKQEYLRETKLWYRRDISLAIGSNKVNKIDLTNLRSITAMAIAEHKSEGEGYVSSGAAKLFDKAFEIHLEIVNRLRARDAKYEAAVSGYLHK